MASNLHRAPLDFERMRVQNERDRIEEEHIREMDEAEERWKEETIEAFDGLVDDLLDKFDIDQLDIILRCYGNDEGWLIEAIKNNLDWRKEMHGV